MRIPLCTHASRGVNYVLTLCRGFRVGQVKRSLVHAHGIPCGSSTYFLSTRNISSMVNQATFCFRFAFPG